MFEIEKIYQIGFGAVAYGTLEIFNKEKLYMNCHFVIIDPKDKSDVLWKLFKEQGRSYEFIQEAMTSENMERLLKGCNSKTFILNLSVNVDSVEVLKIAKKKKSFYLDTSLESYSDFQTPMNEITEYSQFQKNNLYHQNFLAEKALKNTRKSRVLSMGFNPGMINNFAKKCLRLYAKTKNVDIDALQGDYGKAGHLLGLKSIIITEYDSQRLKIHSTKDRFVNTWSCIGLQEEALDLVCVSLNPEDRNKLEKQGYKLIKPTEEGAENTNVRFIPVRGMDMSWKSYCLNDKGIPFSYTGLMIPHFETISMSSFFSYKNISPTIFYCYKVCEEAQMGLDFIRENGYNILKDELVVMNKDVKISGRLDGFDSIGTLLTFENGIRVWGGSVLTSKKVKEMGFESNCTVIQVAASVSAAMKWELTYPNKGITQADEVNHEFLFKEAEKYLGKIFFKILT